MQTFIQKLTSRKLWLAVGAIVATWCSADVSNSLQAILTAVVSAAYAIGEGIADAGKKS